MKHVGDIYKVANMLTCKSSEIIDFSSNINSFHPDIECKLEQKMIVPYADASYKKLTKTIAKRYTLKKSQIALYNGASSAIVELIRELKSPHVTLYAPLYGEYESAAKNAKKKISKINRFKALKSLPKKGSIVVFVNPSTPDGRFYSLKKLFKIWKKQKCTVILDESFLEFESLRSERKRLKSFKKLYIIQSFSKFYSCAGVRIGAIFSRKKNIKKLTQARWNISSFDSEFLQKRLKESDFVATSKALHVRHKQELYTLLKESGLFSDISPSRANYFLVKSNQAEKIYQALLQDKILVRQCANFDFLDENYLRFAVKESHAHSLLQKALHALS